VPTWLTVTMMPAIVIWAVRADAPVFAVTVKESVAVPVPLETPGVSHDALSLTCHVQEPVVVMVTLPDPAVAGSVVVGGVTV